MRNWTREKTIIATVILLGLCLGSVLAHGRYARFFTPTPRNADVVFENQLRIPPLAAYTEKNGQKIFMLDMQKGETEFFAGKKTPTWGINGAYLAPTIRASEGDHVRMRVTNNLDEASTLHWHGMHLPAEMDGGPHQFIEPGTTWEPYWTVRQQAATLWYHPHMHEKSARHVYNGLAGFFIIDDERSRSLGIPKRYGIDDIPLVVQDKLFDAKGTLVYDDSHRIGLLGDTIIVNGTYAPYKDVPAAMIRLRMLNGSNARRYTFSFDDGRTFHQIASDGGFLEAPVAETSLTLAPGERAEILVDVSDGSHAVLMSKPVVEKQPVLENMQDWLVGARGDNKDIFKILELRPQGPVARPSPLPEKLNTLARWNEIEAATVRRFVLRADNNTINGKKMSMDRIDVVARKGDKEIWEVVNNGNSFHPFHIHDVQFLILDRNGKSPPEHERGWKDTVIVHQAETVRVMMQFNDYSDSVHPYMFHCHILKHEDNGLMGQFVVVDDPSAGLPRVDRAPHIAH